MKQKTFYLLGAAWFMVMLAIVASSLTILSYGREASDTDAQFMERYARLDEIRATLQENFYLEIDEETLINGAINGMMDAVDDPYTFYYTPDEMAEHEQEIGEEYSGVGMLVQNNSEGFIEVLRVYENGPADIAGIQAGDFIVEINGSSVSGESVQSLNEAVERMRVDAGSEINLHVQRAGKQLDFTIVPGKVEIQNVQYSMLDARIGYITIFQFSGNVVEDFQTALKALEQQCAESLIIDVRNNPGGLLDDVVAICDQILGEGLIVYTQDRDGKRENYYSDAKCVDLPLVVLINEMSASASEILAASVQDHDRGCVIGEPSFGKGIVQTLITFDSDGAGMQYTSACYYTPSDKNIHGVGVKPDIQVSAKEGFSSYSGIVDVEHDLQLQTAIQYLKGA